MRGALFIMILISLLIVGLLVIKDIQTGPEKGTDKKEMVKKAEKTVDEAEKAMDDINKRIMQTID